MFRSNVGSKLLYFDGKVFYENTGKVSTSLNGWQYFRWMSIWECINYLVQFFTGRCLSYSFSVKFTFSCVHKFWNLVLCLSVQVLENSQFCVPPFPLCLTSFSLNHEKFISYWLKSWRGVVSYDSAEKGVHAYLVQCAKSHRTGVPFHLMKTLDSSAINDGRSMLAMFLTVLYKLEVLETETLK